jgi:Cytochrome c7 and related cytochrome c
MSQIFPRSANAIARMSLIGGLSFVALVAGIVFTLMRSSWVTKQDEFVEQPIQFSHAHHVGGEGIDCRYCHTSVETSSFAGIPPTKTCMNCHSVLFANAPILEPVRASLRDDKPLTWIRVNDLPDFVYFNHQIHVKQGVGCATCHGPVDKMPLMYQARSLQMEWCLDCHRAPEQYLRPRNEITNMAYEPPTEEHPRLLEGGERVSNQLELGLYLKRLYKVSSKEHMTNCSVCHR